MDTKSPVIVWFRRDLRLGDHEALSAAVATGRPVIPLYVRDASVDGLGAAPKWRLGLGLEVFAASLKDIGSKLILRSGDALGVLERLVKETGASAVYWSRAYDHTSIDRDKAVKTALKEQGVEAQSFKGHVIFEPWTVETKTGRFYKVYSPFWKSVRDVPVADALRAPDALSAPDTWPTSEDLDDWALGAAMKRGAAVVLPYTCVGEQAALDRMRTFVEGPISEYKAQRDFPSIEATSRLSENFTYGEISPRVVYHAGRAAMQQGAQGAEHFVKEVAWREFAYHLIYHTPQIETSNWRPEWDSFPWRDDNEDAQKWRRGMTGEPFVDAAMREMYVTGTMHNRARMIVGSYLTKHLMTHWQIGMAWFEECLIDWDPAANSMGWQWVAGCGPDAAPYFRVFNPETQAEKFDGDARYRKRFIAGFKGSDEAKALSYFDAIPKSWSMSENDTYPDRMVDLKAGRERALEAYAGNK